MTILDVSYEKNIFNINREYTAQMKNIIPSRKQAEFVNRAIKHELELELEKKQRKEAINDLATLRDFRKSSHKSWKQSEEILQDIRGIISNSRSTENLQ